MEEKYNQYDKLIAEICGKMNIGMYTKESQHVCILNFKKDNPKHKLYTAILYMLTGITGQDIHFLGTFSDYIWLKFHLKKKAKFKVTRNIKDTSRRVDFQWLETMIESDLYEEVYNAYYKGMFRNDI